jgi:hypothetical protein
MDLQGNWKNNGKCTFIYENAHLLNLFSGVKIVVSFKILFVLANTVLE